MPDYGLLAPPWLDHLQHGCPAGRRQLPGPRAALLRRPEDLTALVQALRAQGSLRHLDVDLSVVPLRGLHECWPGLLQLTSLCLRETGSAHYLQNQGEIHASCSCTACEGPWLLGLLARPGAADQCQCWPLDVPQPMATLGHVSPPASWLCSLVWLSQAPAACVLSSEPSAAGLDQGLTCNAG